MMKRVEKTGIRQKSISVGITPLGFILFKLKILNNGQDSDGSQERCLRSYWSKSCTLGISGLKHLIKFKM